MSKYSKKFERQIKEARRIAEIKNKKPNKKEETRQMKAEKRRVRKLIKKIEETQKKEEEKEQIVIAKRRNLRKIYLDSLKTENPKLIELARQNMLTYEIGRKLEQQTKGEIIL